MASHLELVDGGDFGAVEGEEDAHTLVEVGAVADQPVELGEQRVERAVALGRHGQRHALEEAIAVAVEAHLVVDNKKNDNSRRGIPKSNGNQSSYTSTL